MSITPDEIEPTLEEVSTEELEVEEKLPPKDEPAILKMLPTLQFYQKTYAGSCGNNDTKAIRLFKEYESRDKQTRLRTELIAISQGRAAEVICNKIIGLTRKAKYQGYDKWALMVLSVLNSRA